MSNKDQISTKTTDSLSLHPLDRRVAFISQDQVALGAQLIKEGTFQAAIIKETEEQKRARQEFNKNLSQNQWEAVKLHMPKLRMKFDSRVAQFDFTRAAPTEITPYLIDEMKTNLEILTRAIERAHTAYSEILLRVPGDGMRAKHWKFHQDPFPITVHRTVYGGELEWVAGEISDEQKYLFAKDSEGFAESAEKDVQVVERGDTILFGTEFIHRATSKAATEGYISTSTSPAPPFF